MRLEYLKCFIAVAECGNFTKAAARLHLAQPALTRYIAALEKDVGARLFERTTRNVELTKQGHVLLPVARDMLAKWEEGLVSVASLDEAAERNLSVGFVFQYLSFPTAHWVSQFQEQHPEVEVKIIEASLEELFEQLHSGAMDVAFIGVHDPSIISPSLGRLYIRSLHEKLFVAREHRLAKKGHATIDDIPGERLVYPYIKPPLAISPLHQEIADRGLEIEVVQAGFKDNTFQIVESGQAIIGLPSSISQDTYDIVSVPFVSRYSIHSFALWNEGNHKKILGAFLSFVQDRVSSK